jgi:hypothetical protein
LSAAITVLGFWWLLGRIIVVSADFLRPPQQKPPGKPANWVEVHDRGDFVHQLLERVSEPDRLGSALAASPLLRPVAAGAVTVTCFVVITFLSYWVWLCLSPNITSLVADAVDQAAIETCQKGVWAVAAPLCYLSEFRDQMAWWASADLDGIRHTWTSSVLAAGFFLFVLTCYQLAALFSRLLNWCTPIVDLTARFFGWAISGFALNGATIERGAKATSSPPPKNLGLPLPRMRTTLSPHRAEQLGIRLLPDNASAALKQTWDAIAKDRMRKGFDDRRQAELGRLNPNEWFNWVSVVMHVASGTHLRYFECEPIRRLIIYALLETAHSPQAANVPQDLVNDADGSITKNAISDWYQDIVGRATP